MRKALPVATVLAFAWAAVVYVSGGLDTRVAGVALRSRDPFRALMLAIVLLAVYAIKFRDDFTKETDRAEQFLGRTAPFVAAAAAILLAVHAFRSGTLTAGGADPYGYVSQAYGWAEGPLPHPIPLPISLPWPSSDRILAPLGYRVGQQPHTMVPTYAPGLPLMMALALVAGPIGPFLVVPVCAALLVWLTYKLGSRAGGPACGALAAMLVASSPIVLFQSIWPMSDVPAGALWTGAALSALGGTRRGALATGAWTAAGLLVRPNLLLLILVPLVASAWHASGRERGIRALLVCAPIVPAAVLIAALNAMWYGAPWHSGYGSPNNLLSVGAVRANLARYPVWFWESQSPWVLVGLLPLVPGLGRHADRGVVRLAVAMTVVTLLCYISYFAFDAWWYLRFMLPAMGAIAVLLAAGTVTLGWMVPRPWGRIAAAVVLVMLFANARIFSIGAGVFGPIREAERRYVAVGLFAARALPDNAIVFAMQHSGSIRFYAGRMTIRYDLLETERARDAPADLERLGYHPYMIIDDWEVPFVRQQFRLAADAPLPWRVFARMRELGGLSILDLSSSGTVIPVSLEPGTSTLAPAPRAVVIRPR